MALKYWGKTISDYSAMRGPCPEGFHVPLTTEWQAVGDIRVALGGWSNDWTNFGISLKLPFAGYRYYSSADVSAQGRYGFYWSSSRRNTSYAYYLSLRPTALSPQGADTRANGFSVRCFKNSPVIPTSSWTKLYWTSIEAWWIFWSSTDWLISLSSDWNTWITIMDKNLWATQVWNSGDILSEANCGKYYQRWNNYGFAWTWTIANQSTTQVDASNYWPWNYYSSDIFIKYNWRWDSTDNGNLRWWVTWVKQKPVDIVERYYWGKLIDDYSAMRGPCPEGYHVPSVWEREWVKDIMDWFSLTIWPQRGVNLKMPLAGEREYLDGTPSSRGVNGYYWSSCCSGTNAGRLRLNVSSTSYFPTDILYDFRAFGYSIRPFKDSYVEPASSRTVIQGALWSAWIFWNQSEWLISITDGSIKYTMMDKNLGATQVYTDWATLSEANCGKFYQRGNNYGFPWTGSISPSSAQVDASGYWPGNYYSSNIFIFWNEDWSNPANDNLWWCVTWVKQKPVKVTEVYYNTTKIRPLSFNN